MATSLIQGASSDYIAAQNSLRSKQCLPEVYVYVEGLDDVSFWKECLRPFCNRYRFRVTQLRKSDNSIAEGKRHLIDSIGIKTLGPNKLVAVDADYDWVIDGYRPSPTAESLSSLILKNPYILHTYLYSIENYKCHPLCISSMIEKTAGNSDDETMLRYFMAFSKVLAKLFLTHLVSMDKCDGIYPIKSFGHDVDKINIDFDSMLPVKESYEYIALREKSLGKYIADNYDYIEYYRTKLRDLGFEESSYFLLMQGHIVENTMVLKHIPRFIFNLRKKEVDLILNSEPESQRTNRLKQFERLTGITNTKTAYTKRIVEIKHRLTQLISDCTDIYKATEGYRYLKTDLDRFFGSR